MTELVERCNILFEKWTFLEACLKKKIPLSVEFRYDALNALLLDITINYAPGIMNRVINYSFRSAGCTLSCIGI